MQKKRVFKTRGEESRIEEKPGEETRIEKMQHAYRK